MSAKTKAKTKRAVNKAKPPTAKPPIKRQPPKLPTADTKALRVATEETIRLRAQVKDARAKTSELRKQLKTETEDHVHTKDVLLQLQNAAEAMSAPDPLTADGHGDCWCNVNESEIKGKGHFGECIQMKQAMALACEITKSIVQPALPGTLTTQGPGNTNVEPPDADMIDGNPESDTDPNQ